MKTVFKEVEDKKEFDMLSLEITSDIIKSPGVVMAYPEISHPSVLLSNFSVRDDSKIIAAFRHEKTMGLTSFVQSKASSLPSSLVNRIFFLLRRGRVNEIEDALIEQVDRAYSTQQIPEVSFARLHPLQKLSPSGKRLGKHEYKKKFSMIRMARKLQNIPTPQTQVAPILRRVKWEEEDLTLFMKTWAKASAGRQNM